MDQEILVSAIGDQLDALQALLSTTIALALIAAWAGLQGSRKVSLFSLAVERRHAFYILGAAFILANVTSIIYFLRLADIFWIVDVKHLGKAITALSTHPWPYSPFAYFGSSPLALLFSGFGYGALIVIWWIGYTTLSLLVEFPPKKFVDRGILVIFLGVGLASMGAINYVTFVVKTRLEAANLLVELGYEPVVTVSAIFAPVGICLGGLTFAVAQRLRRKSVSRKPPSRIKSKGLPSFPAASR